jgi:DNA-binding response OmpR family regulator
MTTKTVLIIEDEKSLLKALADKCKSAGLNVLEAENGEAGLDLALREHPDVLLLDLLLPGRGGMSILQDLKNDPEGSKMQVIILSNVSGPEIVAEALLHKVFYYFVKSDVSIDEVLACIMARLESVAVK